MHYIPQAHNLLTVCIGNLGSPMDFTSQKCCRYTVLSIQDYPLSIATCILNEHLPCCCSLYKYIVSSVALRYKKGKQ